MNDKALARPGRRVPPRNFADLPLRPCVGVMLLNREGLVFVGRRIQSARGDAVAPGYEWQMPQGGIDRGEIPLDAALRELEEETGVRNVSVVAEAPEWYSYELPATIRGRSWRGRFRGQTQKWFALRLEGPDSEINVARPAGQRPEFDAWRWEHMERLADLVIPFKREVYERVVDAFAPHVRSLRGGNGAGSNGA